MIATTILSISTNFSWAARFFFLVSWAHLSGLHIYDEIKELWLVSSSLLCVHLPPLQVVVWSKMTGKEKEVRGLPKSLNTRITDCVQKGLSQAKQWKRWNVNMNAVNIQSFFGGSWGKRKVLCWKWLAGGCLQGPTTPRKTVWRRRCAWHPSQ